MFKLGERVLVHGDKFGWRGSPGKVLSGTITELLTVDSEGVPLEVRVKYDKPIPGYASFSFSDINPSNSPSASHLTFQISSEVFSTSRLTRDMEWYRNERVDQIL